MVIFPLVMPTFARYVCNLLSICFDTTELVALLRALLLVNITAGSLYALSGNTEFFWTTYQQLPAVGFNGIPVALLASNHPIGVIFTGIFMSMLDICGSQLT